MSGIQAVPEGITNPPIDDLLKAADSKYALVIYAAKRARQINAYYSQLGEGLLEYVGPLVETHVHEKPLSIAMREISAEGTVGEPELTDDFTGIEIAVEALPAGGTERAFERATHLAGDAQRASRRFGNVDRLDAIGGAGGQQPLAGAVGGDRVAHHRGRRNVRQAGEPLAQRLGHIGHLLERRRAATMHPAHQLAGAKRLLAEFSQPAGQRGRVEIEQVDGHQRE